MVYFIIVVVALLRFRPYYDYDYNYGDETKAKNDTCWNNFDRQEAYIAGSINPFLLFLFGLNYFCGFVSRPLSLCFFLWINK